MANAMPELREPGPGLALRLCRERLAAAAGLVGVWIDELEIAAHQVLLVIQLRALKVDGTLGIDDDFHTIKIEDLIVLTNLFVEIDRVTQS